MTTTPLEIIKFKNKYKEYIESEEIKDGRYYFEIGALSPIIVDADRGVRVPPDAQSVLGDIYDDFMEDLLETQKDSVAYHSYYAIYSTGNITESRYTDWGNAYEDQDYTARLEFGNVFDSLEDAAHTLERLKVIQELKQLGATAYQENRPNYYLFYDHALKRVCVHGEFRRNNGSLYLHRYEDAHNAIKVIGEERLKRYWFGVEE